MPKMLILAACLVNFQDDRGGVHCPEGSFQEVPKGEALNLVRAQRALYTNKADDPDKGNPNTADAEMIKAAERLAKARGREAAQPHVPQPQPEP